MARNRIESGELQEARKSLFPKVAVVKLLLLDVDGVLTDGSIFLSHEGKESKAFNTQDGFGLRLLAEAGIDCGVITARSSETVTRRAQDLKMRFVFQGVGNKLTAFKEILGKSALKPFEVAYMGDDWLDLVLLSRVGFAAAPANAVAEVRSAVHYVTQKPGGSGAVREVCDLILEAKGLKQQFLQSYKSR
jgi:3-deoxy-D-manno-octulosonate 8-phosphate phosphatase (KDO 8-P phosphatase)